MHLRIKNGEKAGCCIDLRQPAFVLNFFIFLFGRVRINCEPKDSSRGGSTAQIQLNQAKVTVHPYKSFGQACLLFEEKFERQRKQALPLSKACGNPKGKARGRSHRSEIPQHNLTSKAKVTVKPSKTNK